MNRLSERKIILVRRKTRLDELIIRFNSAAQAKFYVEHLGADFSDYELEHREYQTAVRDAIAIIGLLGRVHILERNYLPNFLFNREDIVVAIGQDGMAANTLKYLSGQPLIGVNPSPNRWDGVLLPFQVRDLQIIIPEVIRNSRPFKEVTIAKATLNDGQSLLAVNDLFIGQKTHVSARYRLIYGDKAEAQSSSGVIVSTGLGSTGWLRGILAGVKGVNAVISGSSPDMSFMGAFGWNAEYLYFSAREPFPSKTTGVELIFGKVTREKPLRVISQMAENGVIFSDGIESDFIQFNSGMEARIGIAENKGILVV